jgi:hypothetical protein
MTPASTSPLAGTHGFGVYGRTSRIGTVEAVRLDGRSGRPALLSVRAGLLGTWLVHIPVEEVEEVDLSEHRVVLRSGALLSGSRRPEAGTRGA